MSEIYNINNNLLISSNNPHTHNPEIYHVLTGDNLILAKYNKLIISIILKFQSLDKSDIKIDEYNSLLIKLIKIRAKKRKVLLLMKWALPFTPILKINFNIYTKV